jgi:hypothetical protein
MARYTIRASSSGGDVDFINHLRIHEALDKAAELRDAGFTRITLLNAETGIEITELEQLISKEQGVA